MPAQQPIRFATSHSRRFMTTFSASSYGKKKKVEKCKDKRNDKKIANLHLRQKQCGVKVALDLVFKLLSKTNLFTLYSQFNTNHQFALNTVEVTKESGFNTILK